MVVVGVICRIGSLEKFGSNSPLWIQVICRIGSLEIFTNSVAISSFVICRIGSLEKDALHGLQRP